MSIICRMNYPSIFLFTSMIPWVCRKKCLVYTWQQVVGLKFEGGQHVEENRDWKQAYISINACNSILTEIGKQVAESDREKIGNRAY